MTLRVNRLFGRMLSNKGYTIDQTILIVAIIAILITLVIVTVGWQLINRSGGTKAAAQLKQVEDANGQFFSGQRVWPNQALSTTSSDSQNMQVLVNTTGLTWASNINQGDLRNLLPGFRLTGTGTTTVVNHGFGSGGVITEQANTMSTVGTQTLMVVQFASMPLAEAKEADRTIDGKEDATLGRVVYGTTACLNPTSGGAAVIPSVAVPTASTVFLCYGANTLQ